MLAIETTPTELERLSTPSVQLTALMLIHTSTVASTPYRIGCSVTPCVPKKISVGLVSTKITPTPTERTKSISPFL